MSICELPKEIVHYLTLNFLREQYYIIETLRDIFNLSATCKRFNKLLNDDELWRTLFDLTFSDRKGGLKNTGVGETKICFIYTLRIRNFQRFGLWPKKRKIEYDPIDFDEEQYCVTDEETEWCTDCE